MREARATGFESCVERLLQAYLDENGLEKAIACDKPPDKSQSAWAKTQTSLMQNVLKMRCMWKIWSCRQLFIRQAHKAGAANVRLVAIEEHLRQHAEQAMSQLEREVLEDIDKYRIEHPNDKIKKEDRPMLWTALNITTWALLWQMILIYRQTYSRMVYQEQTDSAPIPIG
jgi:hypothetical protein